MKNLIRKISKYVLVVGACILFQRISDIIINNYANDNVLMLLIIGWIILIAGIVIMFVRQQHYDMEIERLTELSVIDKDIFKCRNEIAIGIIDEAKKAEDGQKLQIDKVKSLMECICSEKSGSM